MIQTLLNNSTCYLRGTTTRCIQLWHICAEQLFLSGNKNTHWLLLLSQTDQQRFLLSHGCYFLLFCVFTVEVVYHYFLYSCRKTVRQGTRVQQEVLVAGMMGSQIWLSWYLTTGEKILHPLYQLLSYYCCYSCRTTTVMFPLLSVGAMDVLRRTGSRIEPSSFQWKVLSILWKLETWGIFPVSMFLVLQSMNTQIIITQFVHWDKTAAQTVVLTL